MVVINEAPPEKSLSLRPIDHHWNQFLSDHDHFASAACSPMSACNILFSSGTTATPKAIPWTHTTPLKAAADAYLHHNIKPDDRLCWPTSLGWMMGPWLVFAGLINGASLALYRGAPKDRAFGEFIEQQAVTCLGVVPTLVASWRASACMENCDWSAIKLFTSTGECSNPMDMLYLMSLANYKPIIEYCGGTEIGGAFVTSTLVQPNVPSLFSTPAMGNRFTILDQSGEIDSDTGEIALIPPAIGLSTELLNADHTRVYFEGMPMHAKYPLLRRHGDQIKRLENGYYQLLGRVDDTMNLGGIKISAAEIERVCVSTGLIKECAAVALNPATAGPSQLVIFVVLSHEYVNAEDNTASQATRQILRGEENNISSVALHSALQNVIRQRLNPLFKIHAIKVMKELPKTASNKIMRRRLREEYNE